MLRHWSQVLKALEPEDPARTAGVASFQDSRRQVRNAYITHIRGKKHVCEYTATQVGKRKSADPVCSSRTVGRASGASEDEALLRGSCNGGERILRMKMGSLRFLNGRPEAVRLYEKCGFRTVSCYAFQIR